MKGIITVVIKQDILDPQGRAVMNSLQGLGYDAVSYTHLTLPTTPYV